MLAILAAIAIFGLLSLPGWILAAGRRYPIWVHLAAGFCSQFAIILIAALIALVLPGQLDVRAVLPIVLALTAAAWLYQRGRGLKAPMPPCGWTFLVPTLAIVVTAAITWFGISFGDGGLTVRPWFNADGFKHLAHVHALANFGLPARDIFASGGPLAYYWLYYVIPGLGAALHGDAVMALIAGGLVQSFAFWIIVHGLLRSAGASERWAAALALIGWLSPSPDGVFAPSILNWDLPAAMTEVNVERVASGLLHAFSLFRLSFYTPQHQFMVIGLMSWAVLAILPRGATAGALRWLSFVPMVCAGVVSTLFGISCLATFALTRLLDTRIGLVRRLIGIAAVGLAALALTLLLGVVDPAGGSGLDSPIFDSGQATKPALERFLLGIPGIVLAFGISMVGLLGVAAGFRRRDLSEESRNTLVFTAALIVVGMVVSLAAATLDSARMTLEIQLRASILPYLGLTIGCAWLLVTDDRNRQRLPGLLVAIGLPLLIAGLLTPIHDTIWHARANAPRWTVEIPSDDLAVLARIAEDVPTEDIVLQYPELPFVSGGRDIWTPILAGRMVYASDRSTQWGLQADRLQQVTDFFAGTGPLPEGNYGYVYLSRVLHPASYDALMEQMGAETGWTQGFCLPDACLWRRD